MSEAKNDVVWECAAGHQWTAPLYNSDGTINLYLNCRFIDPWSRMGCQNDGHRVEEIRKRRKPPAEKPKYSGVDIYGNSVPANEAARKEMRRSTPGVRPPGQVEKSAPPLMQDSNSYPGAK